MSEEDEADESNLLRMLIEKSALNLTNLSEVPKESTSADSCSSPSTPPHVFKIPDVPARRTRKNKVASQNGVTKRYSINDSECDDSVPPWNCRKCKSVFVDDSPRSPTREGRFPRKCGRCSKTYASKLLYLQHKQKCKYKHNRHRNGATPLLCDMCLQLFECNASFEKHKKRCLHRCIHPGCYTSFISRSEMITHIYEEHLGDHDVHFIEFRNRNMLNIWKINEAIVNMLSYENRVFRDITHHYFTCHLALSGSDGFNCPSRMLIYESNTSVKVHYVPFHNHELLPDDLFDYESHIPLICLYPECVNNVSFYKQSEMLAHLQKSHKRNITCEYREFSNIFEFFLWKGKSTSPHFMYLYRLKGYAISKTVNSKYHYYLCGFNGKHSHSLQKPTQCLARMVVNELENCVKVKYFPYHIHPMTNQKVNHEPLFNTCCPIEIPLTPSMKQ